MASRLLGVGKVVIGAAARLVWVSTMVLTPLFGFWLASSLAAYRNASQGAALLLGLALFPILPLAWELFAAWRRARKASARPYLTGLDRLVLRTLVLNGLFLGVTLWRAPQASFRALSVRGDWFLDGQHGATAERARTALLGLADLFEHRWHAREHRYGKSDRAPEPSPRPAPPQPSPRPEPPQPSPTAAQPSPGTAPPAAPLTSWPLPASPDPLVTAIPPEAEATPAAVGAYLRERFADPRARAKAVHDYVVLRMTYDQAALAASLRGELDKRPSQQAEDVFVARLAVCEGYARLTVAIGEAAGLEISYITGYIRDATRRVATTTESTDESIRSALEGFGHAWNAVKLEGQWQLMDTTWDDPVADSGAQTLTSTYLLTPPRYFRYDHLPEDDAWQLVDSPITPGDFVRQPLLSPTAGKLGLTLESPTRSQVDVDSTLTIVVDNPDHVELVATAGRAGEAGQLERCTTATEPPAAGRATITCALPPGEHQVRLYGAPAGMAAAAAARARPGESYDPGYEYVGTILANRR